MSNIESAAGDAASVIKGSELFRTYSIAVEAAWIPIATEVAEDNPHVAERIKTLLADLAADGLAHDERWRTIYLIESLMAAVLPQERLLAEREHRVGEAVALALPSADKLKKLWNEAKGADGGGGADGAGGAADAGRLKTLRAVYASLLDELHWFYNKRSLDRRMRYALAKPLMYRAALTIAFCVVPFLIPFALAKIAEAGINDISLFGVYAALAFGAFGALFSRLIRFQQSYSALDYDQLTNEFSHRTLNLRQIVGAFGSLILFFAVAGKFLGGEFFPDVAKLMQPQYLQAIDPDMAKLVIWAFIGGFSERFVPDFLTRTEAAGSKATDAH